MPNTLNADLVTLLRKYKGNLYSQHYEDVYIQELMDLFQSKLKEAEENGRIKEWMNSPMYKELALENTDYKPVLLEDFIK